MISTCCVAGCTVQDFSAKGGIGTGISDDIRKKSCQLPFLVASEFIFHDKRVAFYMHPYGLFPG